MISGKTVATGHLVGVINTSGVVLPGTGAIKTEGVVLSGQINNYTGSKVDIYSGEYIVTPKPYDDQILETKEKLMEDDVTVLAIPYYETSNISGITVYIGGE